LKKLGFRGVVVEGFGGGHVHPGMAEQLEALAQQILVVMSTRVIGSHVLRSTNGFVGWEIDLFKRGLHLGGWLTTGKLHLLMTLLIASGVERSGIGQMLRNFGWK
jgi:L-asparaginase